MLTLGLGVLFAAVHILGLTGAMGANFVEGRNDFAAIYLGARLAATGDLYDAAKQYVGQKAQFGYYMPAVTFIRLPFYSLLLKPLAWLDYRTAWRVFLLLNVLCAAWFFRRFLWGDPAAFLLGASFLPAYAALANGQDVWLVAALWSAAMVLESRGRDFAAGAVISLCAIKPHLFVFVPLVLVLQRRWRLVAGAAAGGLLLLALCFLAEGPGWVRQWMATVSDPRVHPRLEVMPTLRNLADMAGWPGWTYWILSGLAGLIVAFLSLRPSKIEPGLAAALAGGLAVSVHAYLPDAVLLLPAFAMLRRQGLRGPALWLWFLLLSPVPWLLWLQGRPGSALFSVFMLVALGALPAWRPSEPEPEFDRTSPAA
ncbi:MAG: glycosyltransferase family 87 protein [Bryobacteraceae bacterium]